MIKTLSFAEKKANVIWDVLQNNIGIKKTDEFAIIGGNSLLSRGNRDEESLEIFFEYQVYALETALLLAEKFDTFGVKSMVTVIIDHENNFKDFLGLEQRKNAKGKELIIEGKPILKRVSTKKKNGHQLNHLNEGILEKFLPVLEKHNRKANEIKILFEAQCRSKVKNFYEAEIKTDNFLRQTLDSMVKEGNCRNNLLGDKSNLPESNLVPSCKGIAGHCIAKAVKYTGRHTNYCLGIWGADKKRCDKNIITGGSEIASQLWLEDNVTTYNFFLNEQENEYRTTFKIKTK